MKLTKKSDTTPTRKPFALCALISLFLLSLLAVTVLWGAKHFGRVSMASILYTLTTPMEGSDSTFIKSYLLTISPLVLVFVLLLADLFRKKSHRLVLELGSRSIPLCPVRGRTSVLLGVCALLLVFSIGYAQSYFGVLSYVRQQLFPSPFFEEEYVDPREVEIAFPEKKRNLVYILMESCETSLMDKAHGGIFDENYIPELTQLAQENVSFSQTDLFTGADSRSSNWTAAGMTAQFMGIPLNLPQNNDSADPEHFFPGAVGIGNILEDAGYHNVFMLGSNAKFGDRDKMMHDHGNYEIMDYPYAVEHGLIPKGYQAFWGFEDRKLFSFAKDELTRLSQEDQPFNLTLLTVDSHFPEGYTCPLCPDLYDDPYANVWACASRQVCDFVRWIQEQPFYEDTTIVIAGDHCSMAPDFYLGLDTTVRRVYNCFINAPEAPLREKNRVFNTMDLFPTTLSALGAEIEGNRLALGTDLFSGESTLSEKLGPEELHSRVMEHSDYYIDRLYAPKDVPKDTPTE